MQYAAAVAHQNVSVLYIATIHTSNDLIMLGVSVSELMC